MKSKTLITIAVASAFGLSASAFAGSSHEVMTPFSPNESGANVISQQHHGFEIVKSVEMQPSESLTETTGHDLVLSDASDWSASFDQMAEADVDVYLIGFAPMDSWDYYVLDGESGDTLALIGADTYYLVPLEHVSFVTDDGYSLSQEDQVSMVLSQSPVIDTAEVG
jgi:hypothetical protein